MIDFKAFILPSAALKESGIQTSRIYAIHNNKWSIVFVSVKGFLIARECVSVRKIVVF